ncbi:MAG: hypothetical protein JWN13_1545 [Betaproteobacteria bacterium]|jgi:NAD(P)-dependent dehydrogenase (short-subunit alcohol dehydrogenase family)|nr:hypothetical protein [Betaproteobacteria bacterium]
MGLLTHKAAAVTGGGRGLGAALCYRLAQEGALVAVVDMRAALAEAVAREIRARGGEAQSYILDVGDDMQVQRFACDIAERSGALDVLINNAGVDVTVPLDKLGIEDFDRVVRTNLRGPFLLSKAVVVQMRKRGRGHIINITSTAAKRAWANAAAYHASKWGLLGMSHALHAELRPYGIKVTAVVAGGMHTPFLLDRFPDIDPGVLQNPEDVAAAIVSVLAVGGSSVVPELTVIPMRESSWP